ncbi:MAG: hypothetical protein AAGN66_05765 [Acidobacteriota bacterium]
MDSGDAYRRLQAALRTELQKNFGRIREVETGLSRSEGYLSKFCRGDISIPLEVLLKSLELLKTDPGQFFGRALDAPRSSLEYLDSLRSAVDDRPLANMQEAAVLLAGHLEDGDHSEIYPSGILDPDPTPVQDLVNDVARCGRIEQRRRLRHAHRYRTLEFATAYLDHLDALRYDEPREAAKLVEVVGAELVPAILEGQDPERLALALRAIGIYGSAQRLLGNLSLAAAAVGFALEVSRTRGLDAVTGDLLRRAAYVLCDHGQHREAIEVLREALVVFYDLDLEVEVAKVQVDRGVVFNLLQDSLAASRALRKALRRMPQGSPALRRYRVAAYQNLALAHENARDLEASERWLGKAVEAFHDEGGINQAKMVWEYGRLARLKGDHDLAEERLRQAQRQMLDCGGLDSALVTLDLVRLLLEQGKTQEAVEMASGMASLLQSFAKSPVLEAATLAFVRAALAGQLTLDLADGFEQEMQRHGARRPGVVL